MRPRLGTLVLGLALAMPLSIANAQDQIGIALGSVPPDVTIEDLEGQPVHLSQYVGKGPVVLEFWATWCPLCAALAPQFDAAHAQYGDQVEFIAIAVAVNETRSSIRRHLQKHPMSYRVLWDTNGNATRAYEAPSTSYIVGLDAEGRVRYTGLGDEQQIEQIISRIRGKPGQRVRGP